MNDQDNARNAEMEATQARVEQSADELQRHSIAAAALTEAANREAAQANAINARMAVERDALAAQKMEADRAAELNASAKKRVGLFLLAGLVIVLLVVGGIYFYVNKGGVKAGTGVGMINWMGAVRLN